MRTEKITTRYSKTSDKSDTLISSMEHFIIVFDQNIDNVKVQTISSKIGNNKK